MKFFFRLRTLLVLNICFATNQNSFAQTLTCQTSCPKAGEMFSIRTSSPVLNTAGINQVWNFAVIDAISTNASLVSYNTATSVPSSSLYPQADLVRTGLGGTSFLTLSNGGVYLTNHTTASINIVPLTLPLPFAYGNTYTETIITTSVSGTDTFVTTVQNSFLGHGSGTLILPSGAFPDVLSIKFNSTTSTTKNGSPSGETYGNTSFYYYSANISHPLLYTIQRYGSACYGPYTEFMDRVVVGLKDEVLNSNEEIMVFPNPATDFLNIKCSEFSKGIILLQNSLGQQVMEQNYEEGGCYLNLASLPNGLYIIALVGNGYTLNKKLVVSR